ncbi:UNVERIFIED_CONTAM: B3 domain-containing protein [Sesamum calycinum]|uniref:B3 domain-containing protein n=1 Tax=Sesamum calycinum TaxID=2727403 RepID=A0AAW2PBG0_9LAMI
MVMSKVKYEALRQQRLEENKKRMEELHLPLLSQALKNASSPKSSPMKKTKPRIARTELVPVRRSERFSNKSAPQYKEVTFYERVQLPRRVTNRRRDLSNRVYASDEARECAIKKAEELEATLGSDYPTFVKSMLPSHVSGGFWLGLSSDFCKRKLPRNDGVMLLVDEQGEEWPVIYLARKTGLSGGWKKFSVDHDLVDGDALVFQLIRPTVFKVFITRVDGAYKTANEKTDKVRIFEVSVGVTFCGVENAISNLGAVFLVTRLSLFFVDCFLKSSSHIMLGGSLNVASQPFGLPIRYSGFSELRSHLDSQLWR